MAQDRMRFGKASGARLAVALRGQPRWVKGHAKEALALRGVAMKGVEANAC